MERIIQKLFKLSNFINMINQTFQLQQQLQISLKEGYTIEKMQGESQRLKLIKWYI
jgi:hypothetical protein